MAEKRSYWWWYLIVAVAALFVAFRFSYGNFETKVQTFAQCVSEAGVTMYGSDRCQSCQDQKILFGDNFSDIDYVNCDFQKDLCRKKGITFYPVWAKENDILVGVQSIAELASFSGCEPESL